MNTTQAASAFIAAKEALELAEKAKAQAEAIMKEAYAKAGITFEIVDGVKVAIEEKGRANYDAEALAELVSKPLFKLVTKQVIDGKKFKEAISLGKIESDVADAVTTTTEYTSIRVTPVSADAKAEVRKANAA